MLKPADSLFNSPSDHTLGYSSTVSHMNEKNQANTSTISSMSWNEVLEKLINIVAEPVSKTILGHKYSFMSGLTKHCSHLLARIIAEMVHQCKGEVCVKINNTFIRDHKLSGVILFYIISSLSEGCIVNNFFINYEGSQVILLINLIKFIHLYIR